MTGRRKQSEINVKVGDIFEIPILYGRRGFGQVIVAGDVLYVVIFENLYPDVPDLDQLIGSSLLFAGWTLDALLFHGRWRIVGNRPPDMQRVPFPSYKVLIDGKMHVYDFQSRDYRLATREDNEVLELKTTVAPIRYQNALIAHHGMAKWDPDYDKLTIEHAKRRVRRLLG